MVSFFFPVLVALLVTTALIPPLIKVAARAGLLDFPNPRKVHTQSVPRVGGIALGIGSFVAMLAWMEHSRELMAIMGGMAILLGFGVWDDCYNLDYKSKFVGQITAAIFFVWYSDVEIHRFPIMDVWEIPSYLAFLLTIISIVAIVNAINMSDGLDGLSGGKTLLILMCMAILAFQSGQNGVMLVSLILSGSILGFLRFNTHPANVFMGDAGSQLIGFSAAVLALLLTQSTHSIYSPALPLVLFALPVFDTLSVITQRLVSGHSPFKADKNHLHHKLLYIGFYHYEAVLLMYIVQVLLICLAFFLRYENDLVLVGIFLLFSIILAFFIVWSNGNYQIIHSRQMSSASGLARAIARLKSGWFNQVLFIITGSLVSAQFVISVLAPNEISIDFGLSAFCMLSAFVLANRLCPAYYNIVVRVIAYVLSAFSIYLMEIIPGSFDAWSGLFNACYLALAAMVIFNIFFSSSNRFALTTLDFLIIFLCLAVGLIPSLTYSQYPLNELLIKFVVLLYSCECVLSQRSQRFNPLYIGIIGALGFLVVRWLGWFGVPIVA